MEQETKQEFVGRNFVTINQMTSEMLERVSLVHMQAFKGAMNTRLGLSYTMKFFNWFVGQKGGIALVAIGKFDKKEQIVGYAIGIPPSLGKAMDRDLFWIASWNVMRRPWLWFSAQIRATIKTRLTAFLRSSSAQAPQIELPNPIMSLVGLAVMPNLQGQNIGQELLCAFEERAHEFHVRSLKLSVYLENSAARRVYEKCGWVAWKPSENPGKAMFYYKIV